MTEYEAALVLRPTLDDERVQASIARYSDVITQRGGEVEPANLWGKRHLSYEIDGELDGIYVLLTYKAGSDVNAELDRLMRIDENVLRHLVVIRPLPNPPKPVTAPEGAPHSEGPRSSVGLPTPAAEGSVPLPRPRGPQAVAPEASAQESAAPSPSEPQAPSAPLEQPAPAAPDEPESSEAE